MLSKTEFFAEHKDAYATLSKSERERRWLDYVASQRGPAAVQAVQRVPQSATPRAPKIAKRAGGHVAGTKEMIEKEVANNPLVRAMLDPFDLRWNGGDVPRIPDGEFAETTTDRLHDEFTISSDPNGGFCVFVRASPWSAIAESTSNSDVLAGDAFYKAPIEFDAFSAFTSRLPGSGGCGVMPAWTRNAWSISAISVGDTTTDPTHTSLDYPSASSLFAASLAWRPVCAGVKLRYIGPPLTSSGALASAHWPGAYKAPTTANQLLAMNIDSDTIPNSFQTGGPTFESVQDLVNGSVGTAAEGRTIIWSPDSLSVQKRWRPTKLKPLVGTQTAGQIALNQVSDTSNSLQYVLPPPCTGDPARFEALVDRIYTQNNNVDCTIAAAGGPSGVTGDGLTLMGVDTAAGPSGATFNSFVSDRLRTLINDMYVTDMMDGDNGMIIIGQGLPPNTPVYICETVLGVEYIADTRSEHYGGQRQPVALSQPSAKQLEQHARAMTIMHAAPASVPGSGGVGAFIDSIVGGVESASAGVGKIVSSVETAWNAAAPVVEALSAMLLCARLRFQ
jgi:hypothetical protein